MLLSGKHILETWIQQSYIKETISFLLAKMFIYVLDNSLIASVFCYFEFSVQTFEFYWKLFFNDIFKNALKQRLTNKQTKKLFWDTTVMVISNYKCLSFTSAKGIVSFWSAVFSEGRKTFMTISLIFLYLDNCAVSLVKIMNNFIEKKKKKKKKCWIEFMFLIVSNSRKY